MTKEELPTTWSRVLLEDVADVGARTDLPDLDQEDEVSFVPMAAVAEESGVIELETRSYGSVAKGYTRFREGDVLFAKITPCMENGKIAVARNLSDGIGFGTTELIVIRPKTDIDPDYLRLFLAQRRFRQTAERHMTGAVGQRRVPTPYLRAAEVPIAPANEQRRIVERIDELFSQIEAGEAALARAKRLLERYRQAVLKAAVTGELTKDWRERHQADLEPAAHLLARILEARREAWEKTQLEKRRAKSKEPDDDKWKQKYKAPEPPDTTDLPELPEGWVWASLGMLTAIVGGITVDAKRQLSEFEEVPYLRVANVQRGYLDLAEIKTIRAPTDRVDSLVLQSGDLLLNEGGDRDKVGRGWVWEGQIARCIHQNHVFRCRPFLRDVSSKYLAYYANEAGRDYFFASGTQTTNLASISLTKTSLLPVPLPPAEEIEAIADTCDDLTSIIDHTLKEVAELELRAAALRQSILTAAFAGTLVPQDPADEPAVVLLERIRSTPMSSAVEVPRVLKSPRTTRKPRATMPLDRKAINPDHLRAILAESGRPLKPHDLWKASDLDIDDFYKQLRDEIAAGRVVEDRKSETLTAAE